MEEAKLFMVKVEVYNRLIERITEDLESHVESANHYKTDIAEKKAEGESTSWEEEVLADNERHIQVFSEIRKDLLALMKGGKVK